MVKFAPMVFRKLILSISSALAVCSCATMELGNGDYRLKSNTVQVSESKLKTSEITPYIRQQAEKFNLFWTEPVVFQPGLVNVSVDNIRNHLSYLGYYRADVSAFTQYKGKNAKVVYRVIPGKRYRISGIEYSIPEEEPFASDFFSDTVNVSIKPGDFLSESSLEAESQRSASFLKTKGYYGFSKNYYSFEADTLSGTEDVVLRYIIRNYTRNESPSTAKPFERSRISDVSITRSSAVPFRDEVLRSLNTIYPGQLYDESEINKTYSRLSSLKVFNSVSVGLSPVCDSLVSCSINLSESKAQGFKLDLEASTNSNYLLGISPQLSYYHKNIFHGGEWLNLSFMGNFQFKVSDDLHSNELGVSAGISFPKFLGLPYSTFKGSSIPRTELSLSYNYQNRPEYTRNIFSASFGYVGSTRHRIAYQIFPLQTNYVRLFDLDASFYKNLESNPFMRYTYQDHFDAGVGGVFYYSTSKELNPKSSYSYVRLGVDLSGNVLSLFGGLMKRNESGDRLFLGSPFTQYIRGEVTVAHTWRFGVNDGQAFATRLLAGAGYAYGNSSALPFEKSFYSGGANSMRGWQARTLGPGRSPVDGFFSIPSQTGDVKFEMNAEYRFDIFKPVAGAVFTDLGNIWTLNSGNALSDLHSSEFFKSIAADWGVGLRCDLSVIVIRVDMGMKIYDPSIESTGWRGPSQWLKNDGYAVHFGLGYPF